MSAPNGLAHDNPASMAGPPLTASSRTTASQYSEDRVKELVEALEVPFDSSQIEWRVTNTTKNQQPVRGQMIPYANQRAYTDRLNALLTRRAGRAGTRFIPAQISSGVRTRRSSRRCWSPAS